MRERRRHRFLGKPGDTHAIIRAERVLQITEELRDPLETYDAWTGVHQQRQSSALRRRCRPGRDTVQFYGTPPEGQSDADSTLAGQFRVGAVYFCPANTSATFRARAAVFA